MRWALAVLASCGGGNGVGDGGPSDGAPGDGVPRHPLLASASVRLDPTLGPIFDDSKLVGDVDVINVHQDFFGIPWDAFAANTAPPSAWTAKMEDIAQQAHATGKDIFLALAPLDGDRTHLAGNAVADPSSGFQVQKNWKPACYDLATASDGAMLRAAYARYVDYMVRLFEPRWTNIAIEVSLFHVTCAAAWDGMVALERDAYAAAKTAAPTTPAFPSIQIDILYGLRGCPSPNTPDQCFEIEYAAMADLMRDRFAISTYPYNFVGFDTPQQLPADYFTRAAARGGERLFIAETGWLGTDLVATDENAQCLTALDDSPQEQADYFDRLVADAMLDNVEVVTWISNRDFLHPQVMTDCPCTFSQPWCDVITFIRSLAATPIGKRDAEVTFKMFGTMGIRDYDGNPRQPIFDRWTAVRR